MVNLVYPNFQQEMDKRHMNVKQVVTKAGLNYSAICPKLTQRGGLKFTECVALKVAVNSRMSLERLFEEKL